MRRKLTALALLIGGSIILSACGEPAATNNAASKPANAAANANAASTDTAAAEAEVKKFVAEFEAALNKNDADALGKFYDDSYSLIDQNGETQTKASRLEMVRAGKLKWEGLKFSDIKVRMHPSGDGAIVSTHAGGKATADGKTEDRHSMVTLVARKQKDGWKFVHAQITDMKAGAMKADDKKPDDDKKADDKPAAAANK